MPALPDMSIRRKQMLIIMLTSSVALLLACVAFVAYDTTIFFKQLPERVSVLAGVLGNNSSAAINFNDPSSAMQTLAGLRDEPEAAAACIYDHDGKVFAVYQRNGTSSKFVPPPVQSGGHHFAGYQLHLFRPIIEQGETIGTIYIAFDLDQLATGFKRYAGIAGLVFLLSCLVAFGLSGRLQRIISSPILELAQAARTVALEKNYSIRVTRHSNDELGQLVDGFNEMLAQIQTRDTELQAARSLLELRVEERTRELAASSSLLHATLDSTADGIIVVNRDGKTIIQNQQTIDLWKIPAAVLADGTGIDQARHVLGMVLEPDKYLDRVKYYYANPETIGRDELLLKDGTIMERFSAPVFGKDGKNYGRIWTFHDITQSRRAELALVESQSLYHSLVEHLPAGVFRKDHAGRFVFVNSLYCRLKGRRAEDIIGRTPQELAAYEATLADSQPATIALQKTLAHMGTDHHAAILRTGVPVDFEEAYPQPDGTVQYFQAMKSPVFTADKTIIGSQGILFDITELKRAQEAVAYERDLLRCLLDHSPDHIYFKDLQSRFIKVSLAQARLFGAASSDEIVGKTDFDFFDAAHARPAFEDEQAIIRSGIPVTGKVDHEIWKDGRSQSWVLSSKMPFRNKAGEIIGTFGISKDISAMKETEAKLAEAHKQLLETSRHAGMAEVATGVLHNVGNVLNSVNVSTTLLAEQIKKSKLTSVGRVAALLQENSATLGEFMTRDPKGRRIPAFLTELATYLVAEQSSALTELTELHKNIEHIKDIVSMQQNFAMASGITERIKIGELIDDSLRINELALRRHQVRLIRDYAPDLPEITVDRHKVMQIMINLVRNAKYACDEAGASDKHVTVQILLVAGGIKISVADNGIGIPPENLNRIFNHGFTTRKDGHGFGLHSGALAAREIGGNLTVNSEGPGRGATFVLELPLQPSTII